MTKQNILPKKPYPLGAHIEEGAVRFSLQSENPECGILLYDKKTGRRLQKIPFEPDEKVGNIYCKYLTNVDADAITYQFYEGEKIVFDRRARRYAGKPVYGKEYRESEIRALIVKDDFDWEGDVCPRIPYQEAICYCAHVRGFTKHKSSEVRDRGTFLGMTEKLDYLKEIGVTTVELQPAYEFAEIAAPEERERLMGERRTDYMADPADLEMLFPKKINYWGYKTGCYYAPKASYAAGEDAVSEFKQMIKAFHRSGLEVIMQFYFPEDVNVLEIPAILRFWVLEYHVDGFHIMGWNLPVDLIAADPLMADTKLWYYAFDTDKIYGRDKLPRQKNLAVCQDEYMYVLRKYLKGDEDMLGSILAQMRQIPEKTGRIHYLTNYYGMTMMDMVSYDRKHNEPNGEDNRDGNDYNCSWNCGEEGSSRRRKVKELRHRQIKNAMLMLLFSQSTPLIFMGDEFGNSQRGNNNPYCQDNAVTWLDWNDQKKNQDLFEFWKQIVQLRREHPILHPERELMVMDYISCGYPDLSYHGQNAWRPRTESYNRHIGIMFCGKYAQKMRTEDNFFYLAMNMYWDTRELGLPKLPKGMKWELLCSTCQDAGSETAEEGTVFVKERSISVYISAPDGTTPEKGKSKKNKKILSIEDYSDRTAF